MTKTLSILFVMFATLPLHAQPQAEPVQPPAKIERDGLRYPVSNLTFEFPIPHPSLPSAESLEGIEITLTETESGFIAPLGTAFDQTLTLQQIGDEPGSAIYGSALAVITAAVRDYLAEVDGLIGHLVTPSDQEIDYDNTRRDLRNINDQQLTIQVWRAAVGEVRTIGVGQKWDRRTEGRSGATTDLSEHARVRETSPLQEGDLLERPKLDRQVQLLNRHPGRRVDLALSPTGRPGEVNVDYLINEADDWFVYGQVSNTGSQSTDEYVFRFGARHNQLTGNDDILAIDYITTEFDDTNTVLASYELPLTDSGRTRAKVFGRINEYTSSDVGVASDLFEGDGYEVGAEIAHSFYQSGPLFLDVVGGVRVEGIEVDNNLTLVSGDETFTLPYVGVRLERNTPLLNLSAESFVDVGIAGSGSDVDQLGRFDADDDFTRLRAGASLSFFLEPFFDPEGFRGDRGVEGMTLAHELFFSVSGQSSLGNRLVPNYQQTVGGFFTVRGYDESEAVGDSVIMATAEYRFHLGKALPSATEPVSVFGQPFRASRTEPYGSADWDLILRAFSDVATTYVEDRIAAVESEDTLVSVGVGAELRIRQNITARVDYGIALSDVGDGALSRADSGDSRLHFLATLVY